MISWGDGFFDFIDPKLPLRRFPQLKVKGIFFLKWLDLRIKQSLFQTKVTDDTFRFSHLYR